MPLIKSITQAGGMVAMDYTTLSLVSTTAGIAFTNLLTPVNLPGGTLNGNKRYKFELDFNVTTTGITLPNFTLNISLGSAVLAAISAASLGLTSGTKKFEMSGFVAVDSNDNTKVYIKAVILQESGSLPLIFGQQIILSRGSFTLDTSSDQLFSIQGGLSSTSGTVTIQTVYSRGEVQ